MKEFVTRKQLAQWLGVRTATVGHWDRYGRGVAGAGPIYRNRVTAVYERGDVERFLEGLGVNPAAFVTPQARGARPPARKAARSGRTEAPGVSEPLVREEPES